MGEGTGSDPVNHPSHYGGGDYPYEAIKVIEAWNLPWHLGDCVKYIARLGFTSIDTSLCWKVSHESIKP